MHSNLQYPSYFLEIYLSQNERNSLLNNGSLKGTLDMLLRVFPAFDIGEDGFKKIEGTLNIILADHFSIIKKDSEVTLNLDKKCIDEHYFKCKYSIKNFGKIYFNMI